MLLLLNVSRPRRNVVVRAMFTQRPRVNRVRARDGRRVTIISAGGAGKTRAGSVYFHLVAIRVTDPRITANSSVNRI